MQSPSSTKRLLHGTAIAAVAAGLLAAPVAANVNIPEGRAVEADSVSIIHLAVLHGCDGEATDQIEMQIPEAVRNVIPEAAPGWTIEVETVGGESANASASPAAVESADAAVSTGEALDNQIASIRWTGGSLPAGQYAEFGLRAHFPADEGATLSFPVVQTCGLTEINWDGDKDSEHPAPLVTIGNQINQKDLGDLQDTVNALNADVSDLQDQLKGVSPSNVRDRVKDLEDQVSEIRDQLKAMQEAGAEASTAPSEG